MTSTPTTIVAWRDHADRLADTLVKAGKLHDPQLVTAVREVPRHLLVSEFYDYRDGELALITAETLGVQALLDKVYSNVPLTTRLGPDGVMISSSSQPGLMTRMIEALDVHDGHRVLEIGTGTGYNAGLLAHRLGSGNVFSVDIEPELVNQAQDRLARLGYHPTLVSGDGADGLGEYAPYDRIVATCSVPRIPWPWIDQLRPGGHLLVDLKLCLGAGSLVRLTRTEGDRAEGRFDPTYAAFMGLRHHPGSGGGARPTSSRTREPAVRSTTTIDPRTPWNNLVVWFLAAFELGPNTSIGYTGFIAPTEPPRAVTITTDDGSWAEVTIADNDGTHVVHEGGPRRLWQITETAHRRWTELGEPSWDRFGLVVTRDGLHTVFLDDPASEHHWQMF